MLSGAQDSDQRLRRIERILAELPDGHIPQLSAELQSREVVGGDPVDGLLIRLLLNEYSAGVARLRAVARSAEGGISSASGSIGLARKAVWRLQKFQARLSLAEMP